MLTDPERENCTCLKLPNAMIATGTYCPAYPEISLRALRLRENIEYSLHSTDFWLSYFWWLVQTVRQGAIPASGRMAGKAFSDRLVCKPVVSKF